MTIESYSLEDTNMVVSKWMMYTFLTSRQWYVESTQLITVLVVSNHGPGGYKHHAIQYSHQLFHCLHITEYLITKDACWVGEHQYQLAHWCSLKFSTDTESVKLKHNGIWGWGIHGLNGWGIYGSNDGKVSYCFWEICSKNTGLRGSTLSGHLSCSLNSSRSRRLSTSFCHGLGLHPLSSKQWTSLQMKFIW